MYLFPAHTITKWGDWNQLWCPQSISVSCGHCNQLATFQILGGGDLAWDKRTSTISAARKCPSCDKTVRFYIVDPGASNDSSKRGCSCLAVYPKPFTPRQEIAEIPLLPKAVYDSYCDVVKVYNAGVWTAAATCCRRTLEGILAHLLKGDKREVNLAAQLKVLAKEIDLQKPLLDLSNTIRKAGNLGAHFDSGKVPDEPTAKAMLDLIEYLLQYLFILPEEIAALDERLKPLETEQSREDDVPATS